MIDVTNRFHGVSMLPHSSYLARYYVYLFVLWPFIAFITAISDYNRRESKVVIYMFLVYYGLSYVIDFTSTADSTRYAMHLRNLAALPFSDFFKIVGGLYGEDTAMDFIDPLIAFIVSRFTTDHRILFGAYATLFGYFYLKSVTFAYNLYRQNPGWDNLIHLIFFIAVLPVTAINGVRMWTAAWIFLYGAFHVILYRNPLYFIITVASVFMHWSFLTVNAILVIYYFAGNRNLIYLPIAAVSFVLPRILSAFFQRVSLLLGGGLQRRYMMYSGESYLLVRQEQYQESAWFLKIGYDLVFYYLFITSIVLHYSFGSRVNSKTEKNLFSFLLLFLAFVNFAKEIPSFGGRFQMLLFLFGTLYLIIIYSRLSGKNISFLTLAGLFPMLLLVAINFRQGADSINVWLFTPILGSPLYLPALSVGKLLFN